MAELEQDLNQTEQYPLPIKSWRVIMHVGDEDGQIGIEHNPVLTEALHGVLQDPTIEPALTPDPKTGGCFLSLSVLGADREEVIKDTWLGTVNGLEETGIQTARVNGMRIALVEDIEYLPLDTPPEEVVSFMIDVRTALEHFESLRHAVTNDELNISDFE